MFWKIYNKQSGVMVDKLWFVATMTAEQVKESAEQDFDFEILVGRDSVY
jgi:hypothetical protein